MMYWVKRICNRHTVTEHDKVRELIVSCFVEADVQCRAAGRFFTRAQHGRMIDSLEKALVSYNYLAEESIRLGTFNFKLIPKFHATTHFWDCFWNPRASHCYADEDMVGRLKKIYCNCHGATASKRALQRYAIVVCLRWWAAEHELRGIRWQPWVFMKMSAVDAYRQSRIKVYHIRINIAGYRHITRIPYLPDSGMHRVHTNIAGHTGRSPIKWPSYRSALSLSVCPCFCCWMIVVNCVGTKQMQKGTKQM